MVGESSKKKLVRGTQKEIIVFYPSNRGDGELFFPLKGKIRLQRARK